MSDCGLLLAQRCGTINGGDLASAVLQGPPSSVAGLNLHLSGTSCTSCLQCSSSGEVAEGWRGLWGWRRWTEMKKQRGQGGQGKHKQRRFLARWGLYFCPLPCCQVNAIGLFYRWDYSCWHFLCTSSTSSSSSSSCLLIRQAISPRLCKELSRTLSGGVQVILNNEKQRSWLQTHALHGIDTIILLPFERKPVKNQ